MLSTTNTWTKSFNYYTNLSENDKLAFEAIEFIGCTTKCPFMWLDHKATKGMDWAEWFESTYNFKTEAPSATVEEFIESLEEVCTQSTPTDVYSVNISFNNLTPDEVYLVYSQLGLVPLTFIQDAPKSSIQVDMPSGRVHKQTYYRRLERLRTKLNAQLSL